MNYIDLSIGGKDYKLRLNTRAVCQLEKDMGKNPVAIFMGADIMPKVSDMVAVLHAAAQQYQHGISKNDAMDLFDQYLDDGHSVADFIGVMLDIYKVSGLIDTKKAEDEPEGEPKNA